MKSPEVFSELFAAGAINAVMLPLHVLPDRFDVAMATLMGLAADIHAKPRGYRSPRVAAWHEARAKAAR